MAERVLTFIENGTNTEQVVRVLLGLPMLDDRGQDWLVEYEIHGPGLERVIRRRTAGVDAVQALVMTLNVIIPAQLENLADFAGGRILFLKSEDLGFVALTPDEPKQ